MFKVRCSKCGQKVEDTEDLTGKLCPVCGAVLGGPSIAETVLTPGTRIGGYEIVRLIGTGGTGNVYVATQLSMGRQVAVKVLNPELTRNEESVRQFFSEVKTLGSIQHPNIVCAFDSGADHGLYFMAMQYVPGLPLDEVVAKDGPLLVAKALDITESIAEALNYVWTKHQLCHRDIKPGNIMLNEDGMPMLLDFGAVLRSGENSVSNGLIEGSPCFMSPEQARGEKLTFASDLYSLGTSLYLLLTGVAPYDDPDVRVVLDHHCNSPFPLPSQRVPGIHVPAEIVSLLKRMMAKQPSDRFDSWNDFIVELKKTKVVLSAPKSTVTKSAAKPTEKTHAGTAKGASHPTIAASSKKHTAGQHKMNVAPPPRKKNNLLSAAIYLLITLLTGAAVVFMIAKSNTESAQNRLQEAEAALVNVREHGKDPDRALELFRRAKAAAQKFGVQPGTAEDIRNESEEAVKELEQIGKENKKTETMHMDSMVLLKDLSVALGDLQKNPVRKNVDKLRDVQSKLKKHSDTILAMEYLSPANAKKMEEDVLAIQKQMEYAASLQKKWEQLEKKRLEKKKAQQRAVPKKAIVKVEEDVISPKPTEKESEKDEADESGRISAEEQLAQEKEEQKEKEENLKERQKKRYQKNLEHEKNRIARDIVIECRKGNLNLDKIEQMLIFPQSLKAQEKEWKSMETDFQTWLNNLRDIFDDAKSILKEVPDDELNKKGKIYSLAGGNRTLLCHSLMLMGYFVEANKIVPEKEKSMLSEIARAYLEPRVLRAIQNARKGRDAELRALRKDYEGFQQYTEIENSMRSRITGGK